MNTNLVEVYFHPPATEGPSSWIQIGLKFLDWPFLLAAVLIFIVLLFRKPLKDLINRTTMIDWGNGRVHLSKLGGKIDQEIDSRLENYEKQGALEKTVSSTSAEESRAASPNARATSEDALNRMKEALMSPKFRWRTVSRLAAIAEISESEAKALLPSLDVVFDVNKAGEPIAKLKSR